MSEALAKPDAKETLLSILQDIRTNEFLLAEFAKENDGEISEISTEWEIEFLSKLAEKTDGYVAFWQYIQSQIDFYAEKEKDMQTKKRVLQNKLAKLKDYAKMSMEYTNTKVLQGEVYKITLENSGGILPLVFSEENIDPNTLPDDLTSRVIDNAKIREALDSGRDLEFVRYGERGKTVRIR